MVGDPHKPPLGAAASAIGLQTVLQTEEAKGTTPAFLSGHSHARQSAFEDMRPRGLGWQQGQGGLRYPRHKGQSQGVGKGQHTAPTRLQCPRAWRVSVNLAIVVIPVCHAFDPRALHAASRLTVTSSEDIYGLLKYLKLLGAR